MVKEKINADEAMKLQDDFENIVVPWCRKNKLSLHQAFEKSSSNDMEYIFWKRVSKKCISWWKIGR